MRPIARLGVLDRGETAVRLLNAVDQLNHAGDAAPIVTVVFHRDSDPLPWYAREADEALALPPTPGGDSLPEVVAALRRARVDTVWLGERSPGRRADLMAACEAAGIAVVGPDAATARRLTERRELAMLAPPSGAVGEHGPKRRIQFELLADDHATVWISGGRDVSVRSGQTRALPVLAEAPPGRSIDVALGARMQAAVREVVRVTGWHGAAVAEFEHDDRSFALVEWDSAAMPEYATTEERSGVSFLGWRLRVQRGEPLPASEPAVDGVAIAARVLVQLDDAASVAGRLAQLSLPAGTGVRVDASRRAGDRVDMADPVLAVITAWGPERSVALSRLRRALERTTIVVDGGSTNRTLLLELLRHPDYERAEVDEGWLDRLLARREPALPDPVVLLAAATEAYEADRALAQAAFYSAAARGRPEMPEGIGGLVGLRYHGVSYALEVHCVGARHYSVRHEGQVADVVVDALGAFERRVECGGRHHRLTLTPAAASWRIEVSGGAHVVEREDGVPVRSDRPALVAAVLVAPGTRVEAGDPIAVLESMKMESAVCAPMAGEVVKVVVTPNVQVEPGALLIRLRPRATASVGQSLPATAVDLSGLEAPADAARKPCERVYGPLGNYLLGYDLAADARQKLLVQQRRMAEIADPADPALLECEDGLLDIYADLGALYRPKTEREPDELDVHAENTQEQLHAFLQWLDADRAGLAAGYRLALQQALARFGVHGLDRGPAMESALMWLFRSFERLAELGPVVVGVLQRRLAHRDTLMACAGLPMRERLDRLVAATHGRQTAVADIARDLRFHFFDEPPMERAAAALRAEMAAHVQHLAGDPSAADRAQRLEQLVTCSQPLRSVLLDAWRADAAHSAAHRRVLLEVHLRRYYRQCRLGALVFDAAAGEGHPAWLATRYAVSDETAQLVCSYLSLSELPHWSNGVARYLAMLSPADKVVVDLVCWREGERRDVAQTSAEVAELLARCVFGRPVLRVDLAVTDVAVPSDDPLRTHHLTFEQGADGRFAENTLYRGVHPMMARRLEIWRLAHFELERRPAPEDVHLFLGVAKSNRDDRRLFALAEVRDLLPVTDDASGEVSFPRLERTGLMAMAAMRTELARYVPRERPVANRLVLDVQAPWTLEPVQIEALAHRFAPLAARAGLEKVVLKIRRPDAAAPGGWRDAVLQFEDVSHQVLVSERHAGDRPVLPLSAYQQKVLAAARAGAPYPFEIVRALIRRSTEPGLPADSWQELDLGPDDRLVPVEREPGRNKAHIVIGLISNHTKVVPEGMRRVAMLSDPTQGLGNLSEPECRRINASLAYALEHRLPVEWFAVSSGALIAMDSGTENMDWISLTLRRLIEFTQAGGEINIVVTGINVGGQPYWNAEATMLMHTKGILIMTPASAMVLTGKQALDYSGAVSAADNFGIGGYDRVMGPNGQGQYWAASLPEACTLLLRHYEYCYVVPGERFPRRRPSTDPIDRDVCASPHIELADCPFRSVGDIFSPELNAERKQPFDMRSVMRAVADNDAEPLERWQHLRDGDTTIVWDATVGGIPVCMLGIEAHKVPRKGYVPADGPPAWTSGTLFPHSSRKIARAINSASGARPLVVLANLAGFDGSPESMRRRQLEFGAEIGRAVTNFKGPIVFVVVSRYHGGAFVVFSKKLNESMEIAAVEGSVASVIGGTPAAATVFAREVKQRTDADRRVRDARQALAGAAGASASRLRSALAEITEQVRSQKLGEVAAEFDSIHTVERALKVGSVDRIIKAREMRPYVVDALQRSMARFG